MVKINKKLLIQEEIQVRVHRTEGCQQVLWDLRNWFKGKKRKIHSKEIILELLIMGLWAQ
jgi:hypothetical protein